MYNKIIDDKFSVRYLFFFLFIFWKTGKLIYRWKQSSWWKETTIFEVCNQW